MPGKLYEQCLGKVTWMLKDSYWNGKLHSIHNPFKCLHPDIVNTLVLYVIQNSISVPLQSSDLDLLSNSGRVTEFILEDKEDKGAIQVEPETLKQIFLDLSLSRHTLVTVKVIIGRHYLFARCASALNILLSGTENLKHLASCIPFDLYVLRNSIRLEKLVVLFNVQRQILEIFKRDGLMRPETVVQSRILNSLKFEGVTGPHTSLKYLDVMGYPIPYCSLSVILKNCPELVYINQDIGESLLYLHDGELNTETLTHKYKLKSFSLQCFPSRIYSNKVIRIAALTCPNIEELKLIAERSEDITFLSNFEAISKLLITRTELNKLNYLVGLKPLLHNTNFGHHLKYLHIEFFTNVDFASIGACCPNIEVLHVLCSTEYTQILISPASFKKLHSLFLSLKYPAKVDTLLGVLSTAVNLKQLILDKASNLTDSVLHRILEINSLSNLKTMTIREGCISIGGLKDLALSLTSLESFSGYIYELSIDVIQSVFLEINPQVVVK